jgi:hypothetical protein
MAKTIGRSAIDLTMSFVTMPLTLTPQKTSAPFIASASVRAFVRAAKKSFSGVMSSSRSS